MKFLTSIESSNRGMPLINIFLNEDNNSFVFKFNIFGESAIRTLETQLTKNEAKDLANTLLNNI